VNLLQGFMTKRKTHQTLWELESIYYRACRITGSEPIAINNLPRHEHGLVDIEKSISFLKRETVKIILEI